MSNEIKFESLGIVILGQFSPLAFTPHWALEGNLCTEEEFKDLGTVLISDQLSRFNLGNFEYTVSTGSFQLIATLKTKYEKLKQIILQIPELIKPIFIKSFGINFIYDVQMQSSDERDKLAFSLFSRHIWQDRLSNPLLSNLSIVSKNKYTENPGSSIAIQIIPSVRMPSDGVTLKINNHFAFDPNSEDDHSKDLVSLVGKHWDAMVKHSQELLTIIQEFRG